MTISHDVKLITVYSFQGWENTVSALYVGVTGIDSTNRLSVSPADTDRQKHAYTQSGAETAFQKPSPNTVILLLVLSSKCSGARARARVCVCVCARVRACVRG